MTCRARAYDAFQEVTTAVLECAGVRTHLGKLRVWSAGGGAAPLDIAALGPDVWTADKPEHLNGIKVLGTPLGKPAFVESFMKERLDNQGKFLKQIEKLKDLQCAWIMLSMSAVCRSNHMIRMVPPSLSKGYARTHDRAI